MGVQQAQHEVSGLISSRAAFEAIEARIDVIPGLDDQERAALWLFAWSRQRHSWQRDTADQLLEWATDRSLERVLAAPVKRKL